MRGQLLAFSRRSDKGNCAKRSEQENQEEVGVSKKIPFIDKIIEVQSKSESLQRKRHVGWNPQNFDCSD